MELQLTPEEARMLRDEIDSAEFEGENSYLPNGRSIEIQNIADRLDRLIAMDTATQQ